MLWKTILVLAVIIDVYEFIIFSLIEDYKQALLHGIILVALLNLWRESKSKR